TRGRCLQCRRFHHFRPLIARENRNSTTSTPRITRPMLFRLNPVTSAADSGFAGRRDVRTTLPIERGPPFPLRTQNIPTREKNECYPRGPPGDSPIIRSSRGSRRDEHAGQWGPHAVTTKAHGGHPIRPAAAVSTCVRPRPCGY